MYKVDLNSDLGESFGAYTIGSDDRVLALVSSANVACGFHAGDPSVMGATKSTARFASPSFIPGIPAKNGINDSTYPKIMAMAANSPRYAVFF